MPGSNFVKPASLIQNGASKAILVADASVSFVVSKYYGWFRLSRSALYTGVLITDTGVLITDDLY